MNLRDEVREIIAGIIELPVEQLDDNAEMEFVKGWDSIHHVMILAALEEHFDILFPDDDILDLISVDAFVDEIAKLKA